MKPPLVSVIIPTYNRVSFLGETLDSVLEQSYSNWECIVIDDGSEDYTPELMEFYCKKEEVKFFSRPIKYAKGANSCRNYGFRQSKGEYVMWLDDDDLLHKDKIQKQIEGIAGDCGMATCAWGFRKKKDYFEKKLSIYKDYNDSIELLQDYGKGEFFPTHVFLLSRKLITQGGLWKEGLLINQDGEFFSRMIINAWGIKFTSGTYVMYREHELNKTITLNSIIKGKDLLKSWNLIENNIPVDQRMKTYKYIFNGRQHAYNLLKQSGYKHLILLNSILLMPFILKDVFKRLKNIASM